MGRGRGLRSRASLLAFGLVIGALALAGCGSSGDDEETPSTATARAQVYLVRGDQIGVAARQVPEANVERGAVEALLAGPSDQETEAGLTTAVPGRTDLRDLTVENGVATVDLSSEFDDGGGSATMFLRLAQVVFTLTQFPGITGVKLEIDGEPVETFSGEGIVLDGPQDRADYEDQSPGILVETPAVGDTPTSPFQLTGTANTFEANFQYEVLDADGKKLAGHFVTATCGTGCRGTFDESVTVEDPDAAASLVVWEPSAEDGSRTKVVKIPLDLSS